MALAIVRHPAGVTALARRHAGVISLPDVTWSSLRLAVSKVAAARALLSCLLRCRLAHAGMSRDISLEHRFCPRASRVSGPRTLAFRFVQAPLARSAFYSCSVAQLGTA
ncbi:hypothetical protein Y036_5976 [Burkholderia pseudomallei]|uniref:Uncharacterized protein n=1 Tax=Burkholderia pseudomallei TaxID=28450 RepID=A0AA40JIC8_BURPE|nr:hypothetical protein Y036_5976 [Burkholderia pseudomallei]